MEPVLEGNVVGVDGDAERLVAPDRDENGRVAGFDRVYRGAYPLPALPW